VKGVQESCLGLLEVLFRRLCGRTEEKHQKPVSTAADIANGGLEPPKYISETLWFEPF